MDYGMTVQEAIDFFSNFKENKLYDGEHVYMYEDAPYGLSEAITMAEEAISKPENVKHTNKKAIDALWRFEFFANDYYYREPFDNVIEAMKIATAALRSERDEQ